MPRLEFESMLVDRGVPMRDLLKDSLATELQRQLPLGMLNINLFGGLKSRGLKKCAYDNFKQPS